MHRTIGEVTNNHSREPTISTYIHTSPVSISAVNLVRPRQLGQFLPPTTYGIRGSKQDQRGTPPSFVAVASAGGAALCVLWTVAGARRAQGGRDHGLGRDERDRTKLRTDFPLGKKGRGTCGFPPSLSRSRFWSRLVNSASLCSYCPLCIQYVDGPDALSIKWETLPCSLGSSCGLAMICGVPCAGPACLPHSAESRIVPSSRFAKFNANVQSGTHGEGLCITYVRSTGSRDG